MYIHWILQKLLPKNWKNINYCPVWDATLVKMLDLYDEGKLDIELDLKNKSLSMSSNESSSGKASQFGFDGDKYIRSYTGDGGYFSPSLRTKLRLRKIIKPMIKKEGLRLRVSKYSREQELLLEVLGNDKG